MSDVSENPPSAQLGDGDIALSDFFVVVSVGRGQGRPPALSVHFVSRDRERSKR